MDFQNRVGHKHGSGGPASSQDVLAERQERLRKLALETVDLSKDPYFMKNHLGQVECRLCLTVHPNEANYLGHTQGRKHQTNLTRRLQKEKLESRSLLPEPSLVKAGKKTGMSVPQVKIGRPAFKLTKIKDSDDKFGVCIEVEYPEINDRDKVRYRIMSTFEQKVEAQDSRYQFLVLAVHPYETIAFKIPNMQVDRKSVEEDWNPNSKLYRLQLTFKPEWDQATLPALPQRPGSFLNVGVHW
eukprot:GHVH01003692.1.p1 GENE.GHVH01003692.1~~GHVH01003692.1.p1  ORF type:complete len:242 (+),score=35.13 GHVH01003692.1:74-799(+)